ncbi:MAG: hypothetical protein ACLFUY_10765, partial [Desulfobacterales bacterium]
MSWDNPFSSLRFLRPKPKDGTCKEESFSGGHAAERCGQREWEDFYRSRWQHDKTV